MSCTPLTLCHLAVLTACADRLDPPEGHEPDKGPSFRLTVSQTSVVERLVETPQEVLAVGTVLRMSMTVYNGERMAVILVDAPHPVAFVVQAVPFGLDTYFAEVAQAILDSIAFLPSVPGGARDP